MPPSLSPAQRRARDRRAKLLQEHPELRGLPDYSTDPYEPTIANMGKPPKRPSKPHASPDTMDAARAKDKARPKPPPIPVPDLTIDYEPDPNFRGSFDPKTGRYVPPPKGGKPGKPRPHGGHLPTDFEYMSPADFGAWLLGVQRPEDKRRIEKQNQWRERNRRDKRAEERAQRRAEIAERREAVRKLTKEQRKFIGQKKLNDFIRNGPEAPGIFEQVSAVIEGGAKAVGGYAAAAVRDPGKAPGDVKRLADWWINDAPKALLGEYDEESGTYRGGFAESWDKMSTEEQIDMIVGGKSLSNVIKGENLSPGNIARAIALAAAAPLPWGKGLPSLASVLLRAGHSAPEVAHMLKTGEGLTEALRATKQPIRPLKKIKAALAPKIDVPPPPIRAVNAEDADVVGTWADDRARIGKDALDRTGMTRVVLQHEDGAPRAVAAFELQGDTLVIREIAGEGKGSGVAMMQELAKIAAAEGRGIRLIAETPKAAAFYEKIGMHKMGKKGYVWSAEETAAYADDLPYGPSINSEQFADFFSAAQRGEHAPRFVPRWHFSDAENQKFYDDLRRYAGGFDDHIETSIPDYRGVQVRKGVALSEAFPGASVLDLMGSTGAWGKALAARGMDTTTLDANMEMAKHFDRTPVPGARFVAEAFQEGFEDGGTVFKHYDPGQRFDIINESMGFQFISPDRPTQLAEVKRLLKPDGIFFTDEKVVTDKWDQFEKAKDIWKGQFYDEDEIAKKAQAVLGDNVVGMKANMADQEALEAALQAEFDYVFPYWTEGNFRGYVASDSPEKMAAFFKAYGEGDDIPSFTRPTEAADAGDTGDMTAGLQGLGKVSGRDPLHEQFPERGALAPAIDSAAVARQVMAEKVILPKGIETEEDLIQAIDTYYGHLLEGAAEGRDWYDRAAQVVKDTTDVVNQHPRILKGKVAPLTYAQVSQIFAILSATDNTVNNVSHVSKALRGWIDHGDVFAGKYPTRASEEILSVLHGKGASWLTDEGDDILSWAGRKRTSFHMNIIEHLDPDEYARLMKERPFPGPPTTVDMWIARIFGLEQPSPKDYSGFERILQEMAREVGWEPKQVQAAGWVGVKDQGIQESFEEYARTGKRPSYLLAAAGAKDAYEYGFKRNFEQMDFGVPVTNPRAERAMNRLKAKKTDKRPNAGGFSLKPNLEPNDAKSGYFVALAPYERRIPIDKMQAAHIEGYRDAHKAVLKRGHYVGGWRNDDDGFVYLDVTKKFRGREEALEEGRKQGQITIYDAKADEVIPTGLTPEEADAIKAELRSDIEFEAQKGRKVVSERPEHAAKRKYNAFLDDIVRASGKGKRGVTQAQREAAEAETLKYASRYMDDPEFDEFWKLYEDAYPRGDDEIPFGEAGFFSPGGFTYDPGLDIRTVRVGNREQQIHGQARSALTRRLIERPADAVSHWLDEENKAAAMLRRVFSTATASARGAKHAGREQRFEASYAQAEMMDSLDALPRMNSEKDFAHFYWAQLPAQWRNADGLRLVRQAQMAEVEDITSGAFLERIDAQIAAVKAQLAQTQDVRLVGELEDLKALKTDIPGRLEDLGVSLTKLQKVIADPPDLDERVIDAVRRLSSERRRILEEAGVLDEERAANREGLFSRFVGQEPTGEEVFVGHRLGKVRGAQPALMPVSPGVGRARTPQGVGQENKLVLARTGRLRASTHVAAEDWQAAQTYEHAVMARDDLASMGDPFTGRVPKGYVLVNPKGKAIPAHWKTLPKLEEMDDDEIRETAMEMVDGFLARGQDVDAMVARAIEEGTDLSDLRVVKEDIVDRYYAQFTPAGGASNKTVAKFGKAYDAAVDFTAASIVFARVGYIPKNIAQNLIMAVPHQGPFLLVNTPRAAQALADPELRHFLHASVGFSGAAAGVGEELRFGKRLRGLPGKTAGLMGKVADDPARFSAFLHEAAREGIISKYSPNLTPKDRAALLKLFKDKSMRPQLYRIRSRANDSMADFSRLTPTQSRWARRFLIIPGWLWAGSRYPVHFAATHPIRSAAIGYAAAGAPGLDAIGGPDLPPITDLFSEGLPDFIDGIDLPDDWPLVGGKTFRTTSLSPVSTPYDIALALGGQSPDTAASYANPLAKSIWNIANRRVEYPGGSYQVGYQEALLRNLERLLPNFTFIAQETYDVGAAAGRYPQDESRLQRFFRELGVVPVKITSDEQRDTDEWVKEAERLSGGPVPEHVLKMRQAAVTYNETRSEYMKEIGAEGGGLTPQETLVVLVRTHAKLKPSAQAGAAQREQLAMGMTDDEAEDMISQAREGLGLTAYERIQDKLAKARLEARTHTGMVNGGQHDG